MMGELEPHWWWLVIAVILAIAEILMPGIFLIWLAAAAALTGLLTWALSGLPLPIGLQMVVFAVLAFASIYIGRMLMRQHPTVSSDPMLNNRGARLIGEIGIVVEPIIEGSGRVQIADSPWPAIGPDAAMGERVKVIGMDGTRLKVEPVHPHTE